LKLFCPPSISARYVEGVSIGDLTRRGPGKCITDKNTERPLKEPRGSAGQTRTDAGLAKKAARKAETGSRGLEGNSLAFVRFEKSQYHCFPMFSAFLFGKL